MSEDIGWFRRNLNDFNEAFYPSSVPEGSAYDLETARAARLAMLGSLGGNLLAASQRGLAPGQRAQYLAAAAEAPAQAQAILLRGGEQALNRRYREAQIGEIQRRGQQGQALARMLMSGEIGGSATTPAAPVAAGGGQRAAAPGAVDLASYTPPEGVDRNVDLVTRTILGEAADQGPVGMAAVGHVIANRARQSGQSPEQVVLASSQFEPWNTAAGRARLLSIDPASPQYQAARRIAETALSGQGQDPTQGATHFFAPAAQAALGRRPPSWAEGQQPLVIGGHNFYRLGYSAPGGGQVPAAALTPAQATLLQGGAPQPDATPISTGSPAPASSSPLTPAQAALAGPATRPAPGVNGNTIASMPRDLRALAAARANAGDLDGASQIITQWLTRTPPQVQTRVVAGRVREILPNGDLGRDYGPEGSNETTPLTEEQMIRVGVPAQSARMLSTLSRQEQESAIKGLSGRETRPVSEQEDALRTQFQQLAPVVRYNQSAALYSSVTQTLDRIRAQQAGGTPDRLAELDAVVALANLFDPGSVVREGEVTNVQRTQDLPSWFVGQLNRVLGGQSIGPAMLNQMEAAATDRMRAYRRTVDWYAQSYRALARRRQLDDGNVVLGMEDPVALREEQRRNAPAAPGTAAGDARPAAEQRRIQRPDGFTPEQVADRIRERTQDPGQRRALAVGAGIDPRLVE